MQHAEDDTLCRLTCIVLPSTTRSILVRPMVALSGRDPAQQSTAQQRDAVQACQQVRPLQRVQPSHNFFGSS